MKNPSRLNLLLIALFLFIDLVAIFLVQQYKSQSLSSLLPSYIPILRHSGLINFCVIITAGLIPGVYLRIKKKYTISTLCLLGFFLIGLVLKDGVHYYKLFIY